MARCLIIGCGCRGSSLAERLIADGHAVRGTARNPARAADIEQVGAEPFVADPDRVSTIAPALDHVVVACILLGTASGSRDELAALHGSRLEMLLSRMVDSTVRGIVYEASGSVDGELLAGGAERVRAVCEDARIPYRVLDADPAERSAWLACAQEAVASLLVS